MIIYKKTIFILLVLGFSLIIAPAVFGAEFSIISKDKLLLMLDKPGIVIIDVRENGDWQSSNLKIKGAARRQPGKFDTWSKDFANDKVLILY